MHSGSEHFAESIQAYMDPKKAVGLRTVAPKVYDHIKTDIFKGKGFYQSPSSPISSISLMFPGERSGI